MLPTPAQNKYLLSDEDNQFIFENSLLPTFFAFTTPSVNPKAIFLGGQSGSGKSRLATFQLASFPPSEQPVVINSDALREYHPSFSLLQKTDVDKASFLVNPDTINWQQKLIAATIDTRRNLILDGTLGGNPTPILETMRLLRQQGYYLQVSVLAVPALLSRLGIYKRYEDQVSLKGVGRWVGMANHDQLYDQIPRTVAVLEAEKAIDCIQIFTRSTTTQAPNCIFENQIQHGEWQQRPEATPVLINERNRIWTEEEQVIFTRAVESIHEQMRRRGAIHTDVRAFFRTVGLPMLTHRFAQPTDSQLYFNWANDPDTRQQSFNSAPISPENHTAWFARKLADMNTLLLVFENETGEPVGQVRFERAPVADMPDEVVIGLSIDAHHRGKGLASQLIGQGCVVCRAQWGPIPIYAYIKAENQASVRSFERAGFRLSGESGKFGVRSLVYLSQP